MRRRSARWCTAPVAALALAAWAAPAESQERRSRALVAVLPATASPEADLAALAPRESLSLGLASASLGPAPPAQAALDLGQGARVASRLYPGALPPLRLVADGRAGGRIEGWARVRGRAAGAPATLRPGLLGEAAGRVTLVGMAASRATGGPGGPAASGQGPPARVRSTARSALPALAAADADGRIDRVSLGAAGSVGDRAVAAWERAPLVVAGLPAGRAGLGQLDRMLAARRRGDLVVVVVLGARGPALAPVGVAGLALEGAGLAEPAPPGTLTSPTTRRPGLVALTDVAPTVLRALGRPVPTAVEGRPMRAEPGRDPAALAALARRLTSLPFRRSIVLQWALGAALGLALLGAAGRTGPRAVARWAALGALWVPALCLLAAALDLRLGAEAALLGPGAVVLGASTDRLLPWPRGPALPALVTLGAHAVDLARGSPLVAASLLGINPAYGARFYGIGNQLEITLAVELLVGVGALLAATGGRRARMAFVIACAVGAVVIGAGRLGADVGGVVTLAAGGAGAVGALLPAAARRRAAALLVASPLLALATLAALDAVTGGDAHLTRSVLVAEGPGAILDVLERRVRLSLGGLAVPGAALAAALALAALGAAIWRRRAVLAPLRALPGPRAALVGGVAATVVGTLANDSGPTMLALGTAALALALLYAHVRPDEPIEVGRGDPASRGGERMPRTRPKADARRDRP